MEISETKITRVTTTGSDVTINTGATKLIGVFMEGAADLLVKDGSTTKISLAGFSSSIDTRQAKFDTSLKVNISANSCIVLWQ
jgi:hypothetical protein